MALRESINRNPRQAVAVAGVVVVLGIAWLIYYLRPGAAGTVGPAAALTYYTDDDGASYFVDSYEKMATTFNGPNGNEAVRAIVCQYPDGKPFVGWMEKYSPRGRQLLAEFYGDPASKGKSPPLDPKLEPEKLYKRPRMPNWVSPKANMLLVENIRAMPRKNEQLPVVLAPTPAEIATVGGRP